jgi:hypothetical protein
MGKIELRPSGRDAIEKPFVASAMIYDGILTVTTLFQELVEEIRYTSGPLFIRSENHSIESDRVGHEHSDPVSE